MNEVKRKLEFQNSTLKIQCLCKLSEDLEKKYTSRIEGSTQDISELRQILDCLSAEDILEAKLSGQVILHLVETGALDFTTALNSTLNTVPSSKNLVGSVDAICGLLVLQSLALTAAGESYRCPYTLRGPTHPLISVLTNRPDSWPFLVDSSSALLSHSDKRVNELAVEILRPFILYVFLEPTQSAQNSHARSGLWRVLMTACRDSDGQHNIQLCLSFLPHVPNESRDQVLLVSNMVVDLAEVFICKLHELAKGSHPSPLWDMVRELGSFCLDVTLKAIKVGAPCNDLLNKLFTLLNIQKSVCGVGSLTAVQVNATILQLSEILGRTMFLYQTHVIDIADCFLSLYHHMCDRTCLATLIHPLLHTLSIPGLTFSRRASQDQENIKSKTGQLVAKVESFLEETLAEDQVEQDDQSKNGIQDGGVFHLFSEMSKLLNPDMSIAPSSGESDLALTAWLKNISQTMDRPEACTVLLRHLTSAVLITATSDVVTTAAVQLLTTIARVDPKQAPDFLPLLLYVLGRTKTPEKRFISLKALPGLATHKLCVPPILKTILALGQSHDLKPISIRLMVLLWRQQDRCFPQLLHLISESQTPSTFQVSLAKASAILEICKYKPEQHGSDLLAPLSDILKMATTEKDTPVSVMALQGLYKLCEAEVIDIVSLWTHLGETFVNETRPLVIREICQLLSLVPHLIVETELYENFTRDSVSKLWHYSQSPNSVVCAAAYEALSHYSIKHFCVSHLPKSVTQYFYDQVQLAVEQMKEDKSNGKDADTLDVDVMFPQIPTSCFISILQSLTDPLIITAYKSLLQSLITSEVSDLPRGVYFTSAAKKNVASLGGKALEKIPNLILQQYNNCRQPGLRPGLAAGMLFCYDPPLEVGRDGKPRKHYVVRHGKIFLETFVTLLQEVPIQTSDWHRLSLLPQAWNSFMERLFSSLLESRKAELELQEKHGHISSIDLTEKTSVIWLIAREAIMDAIKTTSRGSPTAQGNCILALSSLALCLHKYVSGLSSELFKASQEKTEYIGHSHWLAMTYDTIISFLDQSYIPKGNIHRICHQKSSSPDGGQPNTLCCAIARLAASQLAPLLVASDIDKIVHILHLFTSSLPNGQSALDSPVPAFCNGLALGMMLEGLFHEHFSEMTGSKGMLAVWKALAALEDITYSLENGTGCIIGLSLAICAMCNDGKTESRVHATSVLEKLIPIWMEMSSEADCYQALTYTVATIATCVYSTNTLDINTILPVIEKLKQVHQEYPEYSGVSLSLGLITFSLSRLGVDPVSKLRQDLITAWMNDVMQVDVPPAVKVSKLNGLFSIIGSEQSLFPVVSSVFVRDEQVSEVISKVTILLNEQDDLGLRYFSFWMLGHFYFSLASSGEDKCTSVPGSFSYLPEWSLLRAMYDFLLDAGKSVADSTLISLVDICLHVLNVKNSLPPVNWPLMLSPFIRNNNFGDTIKGKVLQVAIPQLQTSSSAVFFLSTWLIPPLYSTLQLSGKTTIHLNMSHLIRSLSPGVLQTYLERSCLPEFTRAENCCLKLCILHGLKDALAVTDPPAAVTSLLHDVTAQLYHRLPDEFNVPLLQAMAECLCQLPDDLMDAIIAEDFSDASTQIKGCFVRCYMVATGRQPLALLNYMIDASFNTDYWDHKMGMFLLVNCLVAFSKNNGEYSSLPARQQWFLELLGHSRTIIIGAKPLASTAPSKDKVIRYISNIVTAAVLSLTFPSYTELEMWGLSSELFAPMLARNSVDSDINLEILQQTEVLSQLGNLYANIVRYLPSIIGCLCSKQWEVCLTKIIDWIMILFESVDTDSETRDTLKAALMSLHNLPVFRSVTIWTKVIQLTC